MANKLTPYDDRMCLIYEKIIDELIDIETDVFDTKHGNYPKDDDLIYQKYLKYSCLYNILNNVEIKVE